MAYANHWRGVLLFGAPIVGKGTQARAIARDPAYIHIESSALLREFAQLYPHEVRSEPLHAMFSSDGGLKSPRLLEDAPHFSIIQNRLEAMEREGRYNPSREFALLDGVIRTPEQARMFDWIIDIPACLYFDESFLWHGEMRRRWELRNRPGETWGLFLERQEKFKRNAGPLLSYYAKDGRTIVIDPSGTPDEVTRRLRPVIELYLRR